MGKSREDVIYLRETCEIYGTRSVVRVDTVFSSRRFKRRDVLKDLVEHDGYDPGIFTIKRQYDEEDRLHKKEVYYDPKVYDPFYQ